jgi:hypothetical protein
LLIFSVILTCCPNIAIRHQVSIEVVHKVGNERLCALTAWVSAGICGPVLLGQEPQNSFCTESMTLDLKLVHNYYCSIGLLSEMLVVIRWWATARELEGHKEHAFSLKLIRDTNCDKLLC